MVTHDPRYTKCADRIVRIFDGTVIEECSAEAFEAQEAVIQ